MSDAVRVAPSFAGQGVFSTKDFKRGELIGEVFGRLIREESEYAIEMDEEFALDPDAPFRFLNHSCHPNAELMSGPVREDGYAATLVGAVRRIRPGDEITIAYGWDAANAVPCRCGTAKCIGWVVDPKELHLVEKRQKPKPKPKSNPKQRKLSPVG